MSAASLIVLEVQVGLIMAFLGLGGCVLFLVNSSIGHNRVPWVGFFGGVLLYVIVHDLVDALLLEPFLRLVLGSPGIPGAVATLSLIALGLLLGWSLVTSIKSEGEKKRGGWMPLLVITGSFMALHAALDGIVIGNTLRVLQEGEILNPEAIGLQILHRALEGGILVVAMLMAGIGRLRIFAAVFYVSLPLAVTTPWALYTTFDVMSSIGLVLAFALVGGSVAFVARIAWPFLSEGVEGRAAAAWLLLGFFVTLLVHNLAH